MRLYTAGALLKILVGIGILVVLYNYVNPYQQPRIGLSFGFLGVFMIVWGFSYYVILLGYRMFSQKPIRIKTSLSYKLSLLLGLFFMVQLTLIITENRSKWMFGLTFVGFVILQTLFISDKRLPE